MRLQFEQQRLGQQSARPRAETRSTDVTIADTGTPKLGGTLTYGLAAESDGWNPTKNRWSGDGTEVGLAIYDPLAAFDENTVAQPYLAESFTPTPTT